MNASPLRTTSTPPCAGLYGAALADARAAGLLRPRPWPHVALGVVNLVLLAGVVASLVVWGGWWPVTVAGAVVLAVVSTQFGFLGHDAAHRQVTRRRAACTALGLLHANLLCGLSYAWWIDKHNAHHARPNDLDADPDVRPGAIVFDSGHASMRTGWRHLATRYQAWLFFPLLLLEAANLYIAGIRALVGPGLRHRTTELMLIGVHSALYLWLLVATLPWSQVVGFVAIHQGLRGLYLGLSFAPNHKGMPVLGQEEGADPFLRQVLTSRNIRGGPVVSLALGGLNHQIEHHLFPSMPRVNLGRARRIVKSLCESHGVPYTETSVGTSYAQVIRHLHAVGSAAGARRPREAGS
jgi:fatty acid desaturase